MPTARELLEQADALMRRNRARAGEMEVPVPVDIAPTEVAPTEVAPVDVAPAEIAPAAAEPLPPPADLDDVPELTDAVEEIEVASIVELAGEGEGDAESVWRDIDRDFADDRMPPPAEGAVPPAEEPRIGEAPGADGIVVPVEEPLMKEAPGAEDLTAPAEARAESAAPGAEEIAETAEVRSAPAGQAPVAEDDWARWQALAEEIRMQVLQRIDIFTDTALREQLATQLQPIVDRASAEMIATINQQVGVLLRAYIAEAIEREIEKWRTGNA